MMKYLLTLLLIPTISLSVLAANDVKSLWEKANTYYEQQKYDSAISYYEQLASKEPDNAIVYYNLGNSYYRSNNIGRAVLNYEKTLALSPNNKNAQDNLILTRSRISNRIQPIPEIFFLRWWNSITQPSKAMLWSIVSVLVFLIIIGALAAKRMDKLPFRWPLQLTVGLFVVLLITLTFSITASSKAKDSMRSVVMENDAPFTAVPEQVSAQSLVPEGTTVKRLSEKGGWIEVKLPDGRVGWMNSNLLEDI